MLTPDCLAFRKAYEPGDADPHRDQCAACQEFADLVDALQGLGFRQPLGDRLRQRLRQLPEQEDQRSLAFPQLPMLPLPPGLERRLQRIARAAVRGAELPIWIRNPRFAVAASYVLALLFTASVGNPAAWGQSAADRLDRVGAAIESVQSSGRQTWLDVEEKTAEGLALTAEFYRASRSSLKATWLEFVESIRESETTDASQVDDDQTDPS